MKKLPEKISIDGVPIRVLRWDILSEENTQDGDPVTLYIPTLPPGLYGLISPRKLYAHTYCESAPSVYVQVKPEELSSLGVKQDDLTLKYNVNQLRAELEARYLETTDENLVEAARMVKSSPFLNFPKAMDFLVSKAMPTEAEMDAIEPDNEDDKPEDKPLTKGELQAILNDQEKRLAQPWRYKDISSLNETELKDFEEHLKAERYNQAKAEIKKEKEAESKKKQAEDAKAIKDSEDGEKPLFVTKGVHKEIPEMDDKDLADYETSLKAQVQ
jgi:hypothetical protein